MMDWRLPRGASLDGTAGVADFVARAQEALGGDALTGTQLLYGASDMLRAAREVEARCAGSSTVLYAGFQTADRLEAQRRRYRALTASGVTVLAFGAGMPPEPVPGVRWLVRPAGSDSLANQWFMVTRGPERLALVGRECAPDTGRTGRAPGADRVFAGFVSDDERLVEAIIAHLHDVARTLGMPVPHPGGRLRPPRPPDPAGGREAAGHPAADLARLLRGELTGAEEAAVNQHLLRCGRCRQQLAARSGELSAPGTPGPAAPEGAPTIVALTDDGRDRAYTAARFAAFDLARRERAQVVLFDCSSMLYLVDPYARYTPGWEPQQDLTGLVDEYGSLRLGRTYLAHWLREARALGLKGRVWVAAGEGLAALVECSKVVGAQRLVVPVKCARPNLLDRARGHTLANLRMLMDLPVTLVEEDGRTAEA